MAVMGHTHFYLESTGKITLFTPDRCDECNDMCIGNNALTALDPPEKLKALGLIEHLGPKPSELYWDDEAGGALCFACQCEQDASELADDDR